MDWYEILTVRYDVICIETRAESDIILLFFLDRKQLHLKLSKTLNNTSVFRVKLRYHETYNNEIAFQSWRYGIIIIPL